MRIPFTNLEIGAARPELWAELRAGYTDSIVDLLLRQATGSDQVNADETAAAEFAIGLVSRCFAVAELEPAIPAVTPSYLTDAARRLMLRGNAVAAIQVDRRGLTLLPAASFDMAGGPDPMSWRYSLELPGPTRNETLPMPYAGVVHVRMGQDAAQPWYGVSPLTRAGLTAAVVSRIEQRLSEEARSRTGYLLPTGELSAPEKTALETGLKNMDGNVALVKSTIDTWQAGQQRATGATDWTNRRQGMDYPSGNTAIRKDAAADIVAALGIPPGLYAGESSGTAAQEHYRQFYVATLEPIAALMAQELGDKLDRPDLRIHLDRASGSDIVRRSTGYQRLKDAGIPDADAKRIAGVR